MSDKKNTKKNRYGNAISHLELDNKISRIIFEKWPKFVTQKEIANELKVSQSLVSKRLSSWTNKKNVPLKMSYEERNVELEKKLRDDYRLNDVVVLKNADYFVHTQAYYKQIGKYASDILVRKINDILENMTKTRNNQVNKKDIVEELWRNNIQTLWYAEGDWGRWIDYVKTLPEKSIIYHVDKDDIFEVHKKIGNKFCLSGGIPNDMLAFSQPEEIKEYCKKIIKIVAKEGGYILDAGGAIQQDAKIENVRAITDAAFEYGTY